MRLGKHTAHGKEGDFFGTKSSPLFHAAPPSKKEAFFDGYGHLLEKQVLFPFAQLPRTCAPLGAEGTLKSAAQAARATQYLVAFRRPPASPCPKRKQRFEMPISNRRLRRQAHCRTLAYGAHALSIERKAPIIRSFWLTGYRRCVCASASLMTFVLNCFTSTSVSPLHLGQ